MSRKVIIMGAAGRDFHVFNCCYRDNPDFEVVAFTATQIPHIEDRRYPASIAGELYPDGIRIYPEEELGDLLNAHDVDEVVFAYSDVSNEYVDGHRKNVEAQGVDRIDFVKVDIEGAEPRFLEGAREVLRSMKPIVTMEISASGLRSVADC